MRPAWVALAALALATPATAEPLHTIRMATIAPDGTEWARVARAFSRDVELQTHGEVHVKWYFGGIAGDEMAVLDRIHRRQLDGMSGIIFCHKLAPSLNVVRVLGLFQSPDEERYIMGRLAPTLEKEFQASGFVNLGLANGFGDSILFTRTPVHTLAEMRERGRYWIWDLEEIARAQLAYIGIPVVPLPVEDAARAYDEKRHDGFISIPTAALAYQWSIQARYYLDLPLQFLPGCVAVAHAAIDPLTLEQQQALRQAGAKLLAHFDEAGHAQNAALLHGLFERQGLRPLPVSDQLRDDWIEATRATRDRLSGRFFSAALLKQVIAWLDDFRAHQRRAGRR
jgi:TRAP-type C4-dicarboxylate transport system substrate-binding protein